jgi:putative heme-binding domain-containing protein
MAMLRLKRSTASAEYSIPEILKLHGDSSAGKQIFTAYCATCHRVNGAGKTIGPDLTAIAGKFDDEQLLRAIIFPDEAVQFGYVPTLVTKKDKSLVYGFVVSDAKDAFMIRDIGGQNITVRKADVLTSERLNTSIMPSAGQFNFTPQNLRDAVEFLKTGKSR